VLIDPSAVVIGEVALGDDASVWPQVAIRGDMHWIRVGARTSIQDGCVLHITHAGPFSADGWPLQIGSDVTIGHNATLHGCTVGDRVLVGMGATIMDGAVVGDDVVIAAGALVTPGKRLRSGFLYAGSPAREVRALSESELAYFCYSAANYVKLKDRYLAELEVA
jgi:carbonic anhydrase/acetyltransferase-like protein (isoleucine patch superfamily)